ncbi:DNA gyrase subunit B [Bacillus phage SP-15]|uniref:DNA topoisomerase (ATP-hydrolyzing) n=1 Tax=Bacillus phage SP-15 TaxID=1792032 RepID=A0A127AW23_9CAUD|nr:DNA topoisomerase II large subunit [Bacillus phage SP-15]AMM44879.1 DNA gyrase subunit B [Bacillus phage SP-15]
MGQATQSYDSSSLKVLTDIDHIRTRPGMYIGETDHPKHLFAEAIDNALDETQSGYSEKVEVRVDTKKCTYEIQDFGRGIPHGEVEVKDDQGNVLRKAEAVEILATKTNSGGKFDNEAYKIRSGLHGVGLTCINALSEFLQIETRRDGQVVIFESAQGVKTSISKDKVDKNLHGTTIRFKGDAEIFDSIEIPTDWIITRCKVANSLGFTVELYIDGKLQDLGDKGLLELVPPNGQGVTTLTDIPLEITLEDGQMVKSVIRYTSDTREAYRGYTNLLYNSGGGTHVRELSRVIKEAWTPYREGTIIKSNDVLIGLRGMVAVFIEDPKFSSQTKERLVVKSKQIEPLFDKLKDEFSEFLKSNEDLRKGLLKRFEDYRMAQNKMMAQKEIRDLVKVSDSLDGKAIRRKSVVAALRECHSTDREGTELYIVEGESAGGTAILARDKYTQAILPLTGKILNVTKKSIKTALKSEEVRNIVNSVGSGVGADSDANRSRYEKVIVMCDADPDGANIAALVLSVFVNITPDMVRQGRIYLAVPPLYGYRTKGKDNKIVEPDDKSGQFHPVYDRNDLPPEVISSRKFARFKGLGEMDEDELEVACMSEPTRKLIPIEFPEDIEDFNEVLSSAKRRFVLLQGEGVIKSYRDGYTLEIEDESEGEEDWS